VYKGPSSVLFFLSLLRVRGDDGDFFGVDFLVLGDLSEAFLALLRVVVEDDEGL